MWKFYHHQCGRFALLLGLVPDVNSKRKWHRETALNPEEHGDPTPQCLLGTVIPQTEFTVFGALMARGVFLLVIPIHPNNLSTRCPTNRILVLENYLESHSVSHLKTTTTVKQMKLL